ncbi:MAG: sulfatase-like hydrolase/transferase [Bacteroidales bacterium]|jgi:arylsulfatase A-like enzyme|nr:sulfatase-like hydrolase/transferase [Bacteroidales bacterium]
MNVKDLLFNKHVALTGGFVFASSFITAGQVDERPNILVIMTDQQAFSALGYAGNTVIRTPNLDRLAADGVYFSQAITPCPVSVPARTSVLTGRLTETTRVRDNKDVVSQEAICFQTYDEILSKAGYRSEYYGKFHSPEYMAEIYKNPPVEGLTGTDPIIKWESLYVKFIKDTIRKRELKPGELYETTFYGGTVPYRVDPIDRRYKYLPSGIIPEDELKTKKLGQDDVHGVLDLPAEYTITAVQAREAIEALDRLKDERFILTCSFHCPHVPITPSEPYVSLYKPEKMATPVSIKDSRNNSPYKSNQDGSPYSNPEGVRYMTRNYYAFVTEIDEWVGRILTRLEQLNLKEKTLVIFVSDHGEMLGAHGMRGKFCFYEESVRVPFIIYYPGKIPAGTKVNTPVSVLNIFPTILDYAGLTNIPSDGYSLRPVIEGGESRYDFAVSEWTWTNSNTPSLMIRTNDWKLMTTHRSGGKDVEALYDLKNDPFEMNNLLGTNPERFRYAAIAESLRSRLVGYLKDVNYPLVEGVEQRILIRE